MQTSGEGLWMEVNASRTTTDINHSAPPSEDDLPSAKLSEGKVNMPDSFGQKNLDYKNQRIIES